MDTSTHPFRICVFGTQEITKGKGKHAKTIKQGFGYILWNPEDTKGRLPGSGSFEWYGLDIARRAALDALAQDGIEQVQIRTNQDSLIFTFYRYKWFEYVGQSEFDWSMAA